MTIREKYDKYKSDRERMLSDWLERFFSDQALRWVEPFRLFGNIWYVGDIYVCVHLIETSDGLLLIDSGNVGNAAVLVDNIWRTGHDPADVRWIIHSHGHVDHIGASVFFKQRFGTELYLGEPDARMFRERPEFSLIQEAEAPGEALFVPDVELRGGEVLRFGGLELEVCPVPGHTEGTIALFFDMSDGERTLKCGYYGGFGLNTLEKEHLIQYGDPEYRMRKIYLESLASVRDRKVDVFLANHPGNNNMPEKLRQWKEQPELGNPFVDPDIYGACLDEARDRMLAFMADPKNS